ncbi:MAG: hypothetical protein HKN42_09985 [Granulosicoccus sp.]|nr:hypothetical protein [Granulosicoccus sp.]
MFSIHYVPLSVALRRCGGNSTLIRWLTLSLSLVVSTACGVRTDGQVNGSSAGDSQLPSLGGSPNGDYRQRPLSCDIGDLKSWVHDSMLDYYLFYDQVDRNTNLDNYSTIETLITDLRIGPYDTFSYITDEQSHSDRFTEGKTVGFGWVLTRTQSDDFYFKLVEANSPFAAAGVERGNRLVAINGIAPLDFFSLDSSVRDELLSSEDNGATGEFTIEDALGGTRTLNLAKARYDLDTVLDTRVLEHGGLRVGYLHFYQFLNTSAEELADAFATLANDNIDELVLDLRYNYGGRVLIANELASYVVGGGKSDQAFAVYQPNDKYREFTSTIHFVDQLSALNLSRLFVLQSGDTCSASELVVNGLRPFMDVITVGDTSCGKPYATIPNTACGKVMNALELEAVNADGGGGYYSGIAADCPSSDNLSQELGSASENLLSSALGYIDTGLCPSATSRSVGDTRELPDSVRPRWFGISTL